MGSLLLLLAVFDMCDNDCKREARAQDIWLISYFSAEEAPLFHGVLQNMYTFGFPIWNQGFKIFRIRVKKHIFYCYLLLCYLCLDFCWGSVRASIKMKVIFKSSKWKRGVPCETLNPRPSRFLLFFLALSS